MKVSNILAYVCGSQGGCEQEEIGVIQFLALLLPPLRRGECVRNGSLVLGGFCNAFHKLQ